MGFFGWIVLAVIVIALIGFASDADAKSKLRRSGISENEISPSQVCLYGTPQPQIICSHCQQKGKVLTKAVEKKAGISGAKATGAILTGGISLLATGLSKKDSLTQAHCVNCNSTWHF